MWCKIISICIKAYQKLKSSLSVKKSLTDDTIVIHPDSWRKFRPELYNGKNVRYIIIKAKLDVIKRSDYKHIVAYIGQIKQGQLKYMGEKFQWLQLASHGANGFDRKDLFKNQRVIVSCVKDIFANPIAQYCICAYFLFNTYSFRPKNNKSNRVKIIQDNINVIIYGLGNIGTELAKKCNRLGWTVYGVKRDISTEPAEGIKGFFTLTQAKGHLKEMDYVINLLPESPATIGLFDLDIFKSMNPNAIFCNVGRKSAVVDEDIAEAVKTGIIRGAILDAHNEYNYDTPDIILTGHTSSVSCENDEKFDQYYTMQLNAFLNHQEIKNQLPLK